MIAVVNYGSQFTHLIARRLREFNVHAEVVPADITAAGMKKLSPTGIILSGGPHGIYEDNAPSLDPAVLKLGIPVLGICYGEHVMVQLLDGKVDPGESGQYGKEILRATEESVLFTGLPEEQIVWFSHGDMVSKLPRGFRAIGVTKSCDYAAIEHPTKQMYALQFHPEVVHTEYGMSLLQNFALSICDDPAEWTTARVKEEIVSELEAQITDGDVIVAVSGGVDSMVAATVLNELMPEKLHAVFVNHGLLRKDEVDEVSEAFEQQGFRDFRVVDAVDLFLDKLAGVTDPEEKRRIIGHTFIEVFEAEAKKLAKQADVRYLAQGTIYPDRIESAQPSKHASKIKSHHNLTLPEKLDMEIVEPIKELYKDEVRKLGLQLELPKHLLERHPFPGPGLAIRIPGEVTRERLEILRAADAIYMQELRSAGLYTQIWQAFAALLPVKSVGVMGDSRTYEFMISLRAVNSVDGMTADWFQFPPDVMQQISTRIVNEVRGVNRVVYDVTQKPPGTIEYE